MSAFMLVPTAQADDVVRVFSLDTEGTLATLLAGTADDADSVVVSGPMNDDDMKALRTYCANGHVRGVNIGKAVFQDNALPNIAFGYTGMDNPVQYITLPENLRSIGFYAFGYMGNLKHVDLPQTLESINYSAFFLCESLRHIDLPEGLKIISSTVFSGSGLEELTIPESVTELSFNVCANCPNLKKLVVKASYEKILGNFASLCLQLEELTLPDHVLTIGNNAFSSSPLKTLAWPSALEEIDDEAFEECQFEAIVLPPHVASIGRQAFADNAQLKTVTLPASLQTIGQDALSGCKQLESVYSESPVPPSTSGEAAAPQAVLYVPEGSADAYRAATWWRDFKDIREYVPTAITSVAADHPARHARYQINGTRADNTRHPSIYIQDGHKFVMK